MGVVVFFYVMMSLDNLMNRLERQGQSTRATYQIWSASYLFMENPALSANAHLSLRLHLAVVIKCTEVLLLLQGLRCSSDCDDG
jgi:hypothetical protein